MTRMILKFLEKERPHVKVFAGLGLFALILNLPYVFTGFCYDDFFWITILEERIPYNRLAGFWDMDAENLPAIKALWYADSPDPGRFFRPIFSSAFQLLFALYGRNALPFHLLSILLHAGAGFSAYILFHLLSRRRSVALAGAIAFLICPHHSMSIGWISTATDLFAAIFVLLALYFHAKARLEMQGGKRRLILTGLSVACLLLGFASKETAVVGPVLIVLFEFIYSGTVGESDQRTVSIRRFLSNARFWVLPVLILVLFLLAYAKAGFGTNNLMYVDPLKAPLEFLSTALLRLGTLLAGCFSPLPIGLTLFYKQALLFAALAGFVLFALAIYFLRNGIVTHQALQFALAGILVSALPQLAVDVSERQLYFPMALAGFVIAYGVLQWKPFRAQESLGIKDTESFSSTAVGFWFLLHGFILAAPLSLVYSITYSASFQNPEIKALEALAAARSQNAGKIVFLNSPGPFFTFYAPDILRYHGGPRQVFFLAGMNGRTWMRQESAHSFSIRTDSPGWLSNMFAMLVRRDLIVRTTDQYRTPLFNAELIRLTPEQQDVLEVRFTFPDGLQDTGTIYLRFDGSAFHPVAFSRAGGTEWIFLGDTSDPMKELM